MGLAWPRRFAFVALVATALLLAVCVPLVTVVKSAAAVEILVLGAWSRRRPRFSAG